MVLKLLASMRVMHLTLILRYFNPLVSRFRQAPKIENRARVNIFLVFFIVAHLRVTCFANCYCFQAT